MNQNRQRENGDANGDTFHSENADVATTLASSTLERTTSQILEDPDHRALERHLSLFDLVSIGVGGTIGSGIFVLCGLIANQYSGPATCLSWAIAGVAAFLSGFCYAELSGRIPSAGSSYAYAHESMGEFVAFLTAACLTLEFLVSGSAVARSWGDKVVEWLNVELNAGPWASRILDPGYNINPLAFLVSACCTALILCGVKESKLVTDFFTWTKVLLVAFMAILGFALLVPANLSPFIPPEFGATGVMRGATTSFFGYLGFDGICCVAGEAKNPSMNLPRSIMITLVFVTVLYIAAAVALTGMIDYTQISVSSGFPEAFAARGVMWAAQLTAAGEVFTLPVVVLISVILQPRLQYALARDELLPPMFCEVDHKGNLRKGVLFAGGLMSSIAARPYRPVHPSARPPARSAGTSPIPAHIARVIRPLGQHIVAAVISSRPALYCSEHIVTVVVVVSLTGPPLPVQIAPRILWAGSVGVCVVVDSLCRCLPKSRAKVSFVFQVRGQIC